LRGLPPVCASICRPRKSGEAVLYRRLVDGTARDPGVGGLGGEVTMEGDGDCKEEGPVGSFLPVFFSSRGYLPGRRIGEQTHKGNQAWKIYISMGVISKLQNPISPSPYALSIPKKSLIHYYPLHVIIHHRSPPSNAFRSSSTPSSGGGRCNTNGGGIGSVSGPSSGSGHLSPRRNSSLTLIFLAPSSSLSIPA